MFKSEYLKPSTPHLQEDEIHERAPPGKPAFQPYWGKPAVRNDKEDRGNVGIIEARSAPRSYPTTLGLSQPIRLRPQVHSRPLCPQYRPQIHGIGACQPRRETTCSTARPTSRILRSVFCVPAIIRPTGAVPGSWHGTDRAQPSNRLTIAGLRSMRRLRRVYVSSSLPASAIVGAVSGVVGISIAS